jgi:hypothetical protein
MWTELIWFRQCLEAGTYEHNNEPSDSIKHGECHEYMNDYQFLKEVDCGPYSSLVEGVGHTGPCTAIGSGLLRIPLSEFDI